MRWSRAAAARWPKARMTRPGAVPTGTGWRRPSAMPSSIARATPAPATATSSPAPVTSRGNTHQPLSARCGPWAERGFVEPPILGAHEAFELGGSPVHRLLDRAALLRVLGDHLRHRALREHLGADAHRRRSAGNRHDDVALRRVVGNRALGRTLLGPYLEIELLFEGREVEALARLDQLFGLSAFGEIMDQLLRRRFVLRELPGAPEIGVAGGKPTLRSLRRRERPALLGDLRGVALGDGPGRGRVLDQAALPRDQPFVVACIVPGPHLLGHELDEFLEPVEDLPGRIGFDRDVAVLVDHLGAIGLEHRAHPVDGVARGAHRLAQSVAGLVTLLGDLQKRVPGPAVGQFLIGISGGRIHLGHIEPGMLLQEIDPRDAGEGRVAQVPGTATQWPFCLPRYSAAWLTWPFSAISDCMMSSIGSRFSAW